MDIKEKCAREALKLIKENTIVGLGGGRTIRHLAKFVKESFQNVKVVTPSADTKDFCRELGLPVEDLMYVDHVDIAFDGCDQCDHQLCALKSGGGIHTREKFIGTMADRYVLLVDEDKVERKLTFEVPVVVECLPFAYKYVKTMVEALGAKVEWRKASNKDGFVYSDQGNILLEAMFDNEPEPALLYESLKEIQGIVEVSLFVGTVTDILVATEDGSYFVGEE